MEIPAPAMGAYDHKIRLTEGPLGFDLYNGDKIVARLRRGTAFSVLYIGEGFQRVLTNPAEGKRIMVMLADLLVNEGYPR